MSVYKTKQAQNRHLDFLIDPSFQGVNRPFDEKGRESYKQCYLPTVEIKDYNVMINGINFFDQPTKSDLTLERFQLVKVMIAQLDVY